jgi:hypothetical protein
MAIDRAEVGGSEDLRLRAVFASPWLGCILVESWASTARLGSGYRRRALAGISARQVRLNRLAKLVRDGNSSAIPSDLVLYVE